MADIKNTDRETLVKASSIMLAAGFDPQTGCSEAFNYVVDKIVDLEDGTDLQKVSREIADHLTKEFRSMRAQPVRPGRIYDILKP